MAIRVCTIKQDNSGVEWEVFIMERGFGESFKTILHYRKLSRVAREPLFNSLLCGFLYLSLFQSVADHNLRTFGVSASISAMNS
jgi:hypothetical protein